MNTDTAQAYACLAVAATLAITVLAIMIASVIHWTLG
jgi:hypothetical protein